MAIECKVVRKKDVFGGDLIIMKAGLVKGRNILSKKGFVRAPNPKYMQKDKEYWHYNGCLGYWIYEKTK